MINLSLAERKLLRFKRVLRKLLSCSQRLVNKPPDVVPERQHHQQQKKEHADDLGNLQELVACLRPVIIS